jgi:alkylated DNA repair dioxygenase AlkB
LTYAEYTYNGALVNLYIDGNDSVSLHADDEYNLFPGAPILSFSFGASRVFQIKANPDASEVLMPSYKVKTEHDMLVVMGGDLQKSFKHQVPKTKLKVDWRINVTVRAFYETNKRAKVE